MSMAALSCGHSGPSGTSGTGPCSAAGPTVFYTTPYPLGWGWPSGHISRTCLDGNSQAVSLPNLGSQVGLAAVHFSSPRTGVAFLLRTAGRAANVLTYDADKNAWKSVAFVTNDDVVGRLLGPNNVGYPDNRQTVFAHSWSDGSFVVAMALTDAQFGQSVWSVASTAGAAPVEHVTQLILNGVTSLDPSRQEFVNIVGAHTPEQLNAVAFSAAGQTPSYAAYLSLDAITGAVQAQDLPGISGGFGVPGFRGDDYFVREVVSPPDNTLIERYCREVTCSSRQPMTSAGVDGFPFAVLDWSTGPVPWVKLGELSNVEPKVFTVKLPTDSTQIEPTGVIPDPARAGAVRILGRDTDITGQGVEFSFDPTTGKVAAITTSRLVDSDTCVDYGLNSDRCNLGASAGELSGEQPIFVFPPTP